MRETRQRYYAALEHESAAQRLFDGQEGPAAGGLRDAAYKEAEGATGLLGVPAPEEVYSELGMRVYRALESLLGSLAGWGRGGTGADAGELRRAVVDAVQPLTRDMDSISARLERQDALLNEIAAGIGGSTASPSMRSSGCGAGRVIWNRSPWAIRGKGISGRWIRRSPGAGPWAGCRPGA